MYVLFDFLPFDSALLLLRLIDCSCIGNARYNGTAAPGWMSADGDIRREFSCSPFLPTHGRSDGSIFFSLCDGCSRAIRGLRWVRIFIEELRYYGYGE